MEWITEAGVGEWWIHSLEPFHRHSVGSVVPSGFETVTRLMHPLHRGDIQEFTWVEAARSTGRTVHPNMQLHNIVTPLGETPNASDRRGWHEWVGDLPAAEMHRLAQVLAHFNPTGSPCYFAVWAGYGGIVVPSDAQAAHMKIPNREHHLLRGTIGELDQAWALLNGQAPNLWWPNDRSWCVASEIDFAWTYVAGSAELGTALEASDGLETYRVSYDDFHTVHGDVINR